MDNETELLLEKLNDFLDKLNSKNRIYDKENPEFYISKIIYNEERDVFEFNTEMDDEELDRIYDSIRNEHEKR